MEGPYVLQGAAEGNRELNNLSDPSRLGWVSVSCVNATNSTYVAQKGRVVRRWPNDDAYTAVMTEIV